MSIQTDWFPSSTMEVMFDLEADRIHHLALDDKMVESERGVVMSERITGLENSNWQLLSEQVKSVAFVAHPYRWSVIGYDSDIDKIFPILKEIVCDPIFDNAEFEKRKRRLLLQLEQAKEMPARVINTYFNKFLFQDHVYGNPISGSQATVDQITVDDASNFYSTYYHPNESAIALVGDFDAGAMKKKVKQYFQDWESKGTPKTILSQSIPTYDTNRILLINKDDSRETRFVIDGFGIQRNNPDYIAVQVINTILGGRFTSWLNDELRKIRYIDREGDQGCRFLGDINLVIYFMNTMT